MNLQDDQHQSNTLSQKIVKNTPISKKRKRPGRPSGAKSKQRDLGYITKDQRRQNEIDKVASVAAKRAEFARKVPKTYPAIDDHGLEIAALRAQEKIQWLRSVSNGEQK